MNLIQKIDQIIEERSLLKHPFYEMWSDGKLTQESLAGYSKEYFQLVKAVPEFMTPIIEKAPNSVITELTENQQEESDHIKPWISFAEELGISENELIPYSGLEKTNQAVSDLAELMNTFDSGACAMYAFEKEIPKISQTKLDGLSEDHHVPGGKGIIFLENFIKDLASDDINVSSPSLAINPGLTPIGSRPAYKISFVSSYIVNINTPSSWSMVFLIPSSLNRCKIISQSDPVERL